MSKFPFSQLRPVVNYMPEGGASPTVNESSSRSECTPYFIGEAQTINSLTEGRQGASAYTELPDGRIVVTWRSERGDGSGTSVRAQIFSADLEKIGDEFQVNTYTQYDQTLPSITTLADGGFVIVWHSDRQDNDDYGIYGQRYSVDGQRAGEEFQVSTYTGYKQWHSEVEATEDGGFSVFWSKHVGTNYTNDDRMEMRNYDADGNPTGPSVKVIGMFDDDMKNIEVIKLPDGNLFMVFNQSDGSGQGIYAKVINAQGEDVIAPIIVNTEIVSYQQNPKTALLNDGSFLVTWESLRQDGDMYGIYAQRLSSDLTPIGDEFKINSSVEGNQFRQGITALDDGGYLVSWTGKALGSSSSEVFAQRFDANDNRVGDEFIINSFTDGYQGSPKIEQLSSGKILVTWYSNGGEDGSLGSVQGQLLSLTPPNHAPDAQTENISIIEDAAILHGQLDATDEDGDALVYSLITPAPAGLVLNSDGSYTFDPSHEDYQHLGFEEEIIFNLEYQVDDGQGEGNSVSQGHFQIKVIGQNDGPIASDLNLTVTEDTSFVTGEVSVSDVDNDSDDLEFSWNGNGATPVFIEGNNFKIDINTEEFQNLALGETKDVSYTYTVSDGDGGSDTATVNVTIEGQNDGVVAVDDTDLDIYTSHFTVKAATLLANDYDIDTSETGLLSIVSIVNPIGGEIELFYDAGGKIETIAFKAFEDYVGEIGFSYQIQGAHGDQDTADVRFNLVENTNDAPIALDDLILGGIYADVIEGSDADDALAGGGGDDTISGGDGNDLIVGGDGADTLSGGAGDDHIIADQNDVVQGGSGRDHVEYTGGGSGSGGGVNVNMGNQGVEEVTGSFGNDVIDGSTVPASSNGSGVVVRGGAGNDVIIGSQGNDHLSGGTGDDQIHVTGGSSNIVNGGTGTDTVHFGGASGGYSFDRGTSGNGGSGRHFTMKDQDGNVTTLDDIEILKFNDVTIEFGENYEIKQTGIFEDSVAYIPVSLLLLNDSDPNGDPISVTAVTNGPNSSVELVEKFGQTCVKFTPDPDYFGLTTFEYTISDPYGLTDTATVNVLVQPVDDAPEIIAGPDLGTVLEDDEFDFTEQQLLQYVREVDGDPLTIQDVTSKNGTVINNGDGTYTFKPLSDFNGTAHLNLSVSDGISVVSGPLSVEVVNVNDAPVMTSVASFIAETRTITITKADLLSQIEDRDGDDLTISNLTSSQGELIENQDGTWSFTLPASMTDDVDLTYSVSDGEATISATATITDNRTVNEGVDIETIWENGNFDFSGASEFQVNQLTAGSQHRPSVESLENGNFVVSWTSGSDIYMRLYNAQGTALGNEVRISTGGSGLSFVTDSEDGGFIVLWNKNSGLLAQRFDSSGATIGDEIQVTPVGNVGVTHSHITQLENGYQVATWGQSDGRIQAQIIDQNGDLVGSQISVSPSSSLVFRPTVSALENGGFVVAWEGVSGGEMRIFDENGQAITAILDASATDGRRQVVTGVETLADGSFIVGWKDAGVIFSHRFDENGVSMQTHDSRISSRSLPMDLPIFKALDDGGYFVTWEEVSSATSYDIYGKRFDKDGNAVTGDIRLNDYLPGYQIGAEFTVLSDGSLAVAWESNGQDGDSNGIFAKIIDFDGEVIGEKIQGTSGDNLIEGSEGDDELIGAGGNDELRGGDGDDELIGAGGNDELRGGDGDDTISGGDGNDLIVGGAGVDTLSGGSGNDTLEGGDGRDIAVYSGQRSDYLVEEIADGLRITDTRVDGDGVDIVRNVETFRFSDGDVSLNAMISDQFELGSAMEDTSDFQVNSFTLGLQADAKIAALRNGEMIVTWVSGGQDGDNYGIYAQRMDKYGTKLGEEIQVHSYTNGAQQYPSVTDLNDGGYIVTWSSSGQEDGWNIYAQRFDANDARVGGEFLVNSTTARVLPYSDVVNLNDGGYAIVWEDQGGVTFQRFDENNIEIGAATSVATSGEKPLITSLENDDVLVTWNDEGVDGQIYHADGRVTGPLPLSADALNYSVSTLVDGGFVVAWQNSAKNIHTMRFNEFGEALDDGPLRINQPSYDIPAVVDVTALADGGYLVTWVSERDGDYSSISARRLDANNQYIGDEFVVNDWAPGTQWRPEVVSLADGSVTITWESVGQDGDSYGVFAKTFDFPAAFDLVEGSATDDTLTGSVRKEHLIGLDGNDMLNGAEGDDTLTGGSGNDTLEGGDGRDIAVYSGQRSDYLVEEIADGLRITDTRVDGDGVDIVRNVETFRFSDGDVSLNAMISDQFELGSVMEDTSDFQVNSFTLGLQADAKIAALRNGEMIVTWVSGGQDGDNYGIYAQRMDKYGTKLGEEIQVHSYTNGAQQYPSVTDLNDGGYIVTWSSSGQEDGWNIYAQRFDANDARVGGEFLVNSTTARVLPYSDVVNLNDGGYAIVWEDQGGVTFQRFDENNIEIGAATSVATSGEKPLITSLENDDVLVTWNDEGVDGQIYHADGRVTGPLPLSADALNYSVSTLVDGGFVVAWQNSAKNIHTMRFNEFGEALDDGPLRINQPSYDIPAVVDVTALADGGYLVTWVSERDGDYSSISARRLDANNQYIGDEFVVNDWAPGTQWRPEVVSLADGSVTITWESVGQDGDSYGVFAKTFDFPAAFDLVEGSATDDTLTGSVRKEHLIGLDGNDMLNGAEGDDTLTGGSGNDTLEGGDGRDIAVYSGQRSDYLVEEIADGLRITDTRVDGDGVDIVRNVETFRFSDGDVSLNAMISDQFELGSVMEDTSDFQVNSFTLGLQADAKIAALRNGEMIVTWVSGGQDGDNYGIYAQRMDKYGTKLGEEIQVHSYTNGAQQYPSVTDLNDGGYIVTWSSSGQEDGWNIYAQRFDANDARVGGEFLVNSTTARVLPYSDVVNLNDGGYAIVWEDQGGVTFQRFDENNIEIGAATSVATSGEKPLITSLENDDVLVTWNDEGVDGQIYHADGRVTGPLPLSADALNYSVSTLVDGGFVVAWQNSAKNIHTMRFNEFGEALDDGPLRINQPSYDIPAVVDVTALADGGYLVTWVSERDGDYSSISARRLDANNQYIGDEFVVNDWAPGTQWRPEVVSLADGSVTITWESVGQDGDSYGVFAKTFDFPAAFDLVEGSATDDTLTGSVRKEHLIGLDGNDMLNGAEGDDTLTGGSGNDTLEGGDGRDIAVYSGQRSDYLVEEIADGLRITDTRVDGDGVDIVRNVETFRFSDGDVSLNAMISDQFELGSVMEDTSDFQVNSFTLGLQADAKIAALRNGEMIVTWVSGGQDGDNYGIYAQRMDKYGTKLGEEIQVHSYTNGAQQYPSVTDLNDGGYIVTWSSSGQEDGWNIYAQRFDANDARVGGEFLVNSTTARVLPYSDVVNLNDGGYAIVWEDQGGVTFQRFDENNIEIGAATSVATSGEKPLITSLENDDVLVTWNDEGVDGQIYHADGRVTGPLPLSADALNYSVSTLVDGGFVVAWQNSAKNIHTMRFNEFGEALDDGPLRINQPSYDIPAVVDVTALADGGYLVTWVSERDGDYSSISARRLDANNQYIGDEFVVNDWAPGTQWRPEVVSLADGSVTITWESVGQDGDSYGVFAKTFDFPAAFDLVEGSATDDTLTGSVRKEHLIGLDGNDMLNGAEGDDTLTGGSGNDTLEGGDGRDIAVYSGQRSDYLVEEIADGLRITDTRVDGDGVDIVRNVETFRFSDGDVSLNAMISDQFELGSVMEDTSDFQVNSFTLGLQADAKIAALRNGEMIVTWVSGGQDGDNYGIYAQRMDKYGTKLGEEIQVHSYTNGAQQYPSVTDLNDGGYIVTWSSSGQEDGWNIYAQRFDANDARVGGEFLVNSTTARVLPYSDVVNLNDGGYAIVWEDQGGVTFQRFDENNIEIGAATSVATSGEKPLITSLENDDVLVTWNDEGVDGQIYHADGRVTGPLPLSADALNYSVSTLVDGGFVVAWQNSAKNIHTMRFNEFGEALDDGPLRINQPSYDIPAVVDVTALADGGYLVTWVSERDGDYSSISARRLDANNQYIGDEFVVNDWAPGTQWRPEVVSLADGSVTITWESVGQDGDSYGVFAKTFDFPAAFDLVEGSATDDTLTGSVRKEHLIGLDGNDMLNGAEGDDTLTGGSGNDTLEGGDGRDIAVYSGQRSDYLVEEIADGLRITDTRVDGDGVDIVRNVETFRFSDGDVSLNAMISDQFELGSVMNTTFEFQVNSFTSGTLYEPDIAALNNGEMVVTWESEGDTYVQHMDKYGTKLSDEIRVNSTIDGLQSNSSITNLDDGGYIVTWSSSGQTDGWDIYAQRFDANDERVDGEFLVNSTTIGHQVSSDVVNLNDGGYAIVWEDQDGVTFQRFDENNVKNGSETSVVTSGNTPLITSLENGDVMVTWNDDGIDGQIYHADGRVTGPLSLSTQALNYSVSTLVDGGFVVAWQSPDKNVHTMRFNDLGEALDGNPLRINEPSYDVDANVDVTALADGGYIVTWMANPDEYTTNIVARRIDADGTFIGEEMRINDWEADELSHPEVVSLADGSVTITWQSAGIHNSNLGVFAKTIDFPAAVKTVEGSATDDTLTGSVRKEHLIGLDGNDTLNGAEGDDTLTGGSGNDTLEGGDGRDTFIFASEEEASSALSHLERVSSLGHDLVKDFETGEDNISLNDLDFGFALGNLVEGDTYFEVDDLANLDANGGPAIVLIGDETGNGGVEVWYTEDASNMNTSEGTGNSYQVADLENINTTQISVSDFKVE